jgi:hypothetical protein
VEGVILASPAFWAEAHVPQHLCPDTSHPERSRLTLSGLQVDLALSDSSLTPQLGFTLLLP